MSKVTIRPDELEREMQNILKEVGVKSENALTATLKIEAKATSSELSKTSPRRSGKYAKNWRWKEEAKTQFVVYNDKPTYRLTHLLENGHKTRLGTGRTRRRYGSKAFVAAQPHIKAAEEKMKNEIEDVYAKQVSNQLKTI